MSLNEMILSADARRKAKPKAKKPTAPKPPVRVKNWEVNRR